MQNIVQITPQPLSSFKQFDRNFHPAHYTYATSIIILISTSNPPPAHRNEYISVSTQGVCSKKRSGKPTETSWAAACTASNLIVIVITIDHQQNHHIVLTSPSDGVLINGWKYSCTKRPLLRYVFIQLLLSSQFQSSVGSSSSHCLESGDNNWATLPKTSCGKSETERMAGRILSKHRLRHIQRRLF